MQRDLINPTGAPEELWSTAPNPKPSPAEKRDFGRFTNPYATFSVDFAEFVCRTLVQQGVRFIWDPFAGSGTIGAAARSFDCHVVLSDLNPFATLCSLVRTSRRSSAFMAEQIGAAPLQSRMNEAIDLSATWEWLDARLLDLQIDHARLSEILRGPGGHLSDAEQAALILLLACASYALHLSRGRVGSNPAWNAKSSRPHTSAQQETYITFHEHLRALATHLRNLEPTHARFCVTATTSDAVRDAPPIGKVDAVVTSPPYLNRLDHYMQLAPAAAPLLKMLGIEEAAFRSNQMGTTRIREKIERPAAFPANVANTLASIRSHPSYASGRYYYWGYYYYFSDMLRFLETATDALKTDGYFIVVLQSSFYKDVKIDLPGLVGSMAESVGLQRLASREWAVTRHLGQINPRQARKQLIETATIFRKMSSRNPAR